MHPELKAQTEVAIKNKDDRSFIDPANFYESERNSGYKNTGNALYEIIDNAYEANASKLFIVAKNNIYLSTSNGRLLLIDYITGRTKAAYKIDNGKISNPIILGKSFYLAKESSIIRLN